MPQCAHTVWVRVNVWSVSFSIVNGQPSVASSMKMKIVGPSILTSARMRRMSWLLSEACKRKCTLPISSRLMAGDLYSMSDID